MKSNIRHLDGSINVSDGINVIVSPYSETFFDNIEEYVKEPISVLLELGYLPISSCDGFHSFNGSCHISLILSNKESAYSLIKTVNSFGIRAIIDNSFDHLSLKIINEIFIRNYTEYACVTIVLYDSSFLSRLFKKFLIKRNTSKLKKLERYLE